MKQLRFLALALLAAWNFSCDKDSGKGEDITKEGELPNGTEISGDISKNTLLKKGTLTPFAGESM